MNGTTAWASESGTTVSSTRVSPCSAMKTAITIVMKRCTSSIAKRGQAKRARADIRTPSTTPAESSR